ncbi:MAG: DnaD domain protein [Bacillota bacterium]
MPRFLVRPSPGGATTVANSFIREHLPSAPEGYVKAYLFGLMLARSDAGEDIAALKMDAETLCSAFLYWQERGLVHVLSRSPLEIEFLNEAHAPVASAQFAPQAPRYGALLEGISKLLSGRQLNVGELARVYDWIEVFGLEEDAVEALVAHCVESTRRSNVSIKYMDAVAKAWADAGVKTAKDAKEHLEGYEKRHGGAAKILKVWSQNAQPTEPQLELYDKWTRGWGMEPEMILLASRQTASANTPTFQYLNAILEDYRARGLLDHKSLSSFLAARSERETQVRHQARMLFERAGIRRSPNREDREQIDVWIYDWGMPMEVLFYAAESSAGASMPFAYMKKIVAQLHREGVRTLDAARSRKLEHRRETAAAKATNWDYPQRGYSEEELKRILNKPGRNDDGADQKGV